MSTPFSDHEGDFVAGSLLGIREFQLSHTGELTGLHYNSPFLPGENIAVCGGSMSPAHKGDEHKVAGLHCSCGFYAYFPDEASPPIRSRVTTIFEGYGRTTVGAKGFRSEKARIVAIVDPATPCKKTPFFQRTCLWVYRKPKLLVPPTVAALAVGVIGTFVLTAFSPKWLYLTLPLFAAAIVMLIMAAKGGGYAYNAVGDSARPPEVLLKKMREKYDGIPRYPTLEEALQEHPVPESQKQIP